MASAASSSVEKAAVIEVIDDSDISSGMHSNGVRACERIF
jgi:hypothetical protein